MIEQYHQEISSLEEQVGKLQETGARDATCTREAQAQVTSLQAEVDAWEVELQCMHNDLMVACEQLETQKKEKEAAKRECTEVEQDLATANVKLQKAENE